MEPLVTNKLMPESLRLLRLIAATTGEKQYAVMQRLLETEMKRLNIQIGKVVRLS